MPVKPLLNACNACDQCGRVLRWVRGRTDAIPPVHDFVAAVKHSDDLLAYRVQVVGSSVAWVCWHGGQFVAYDTHPDGELFTGPLAVDFLRWGFNTDDVRVQVRTKREIDDSIPSTVWSGYE